MKGSKVQRRKGSRKLKITRTVIVPKWQKNLKAGIRGLKRNVMYILAGIGGMWVIWQTMLWISARMGGG